MTREIDLRTEKQKERLARVTGVTQPGKPIKTAPPAQPVAQAGGPKLTEPLPMGKLVAGRRTAESLTELEKQHIATLGGLDPGTTIPAGMQKIVEQVRAEQQAELTGLSQAPGQRFRDLVGKTNEVEQAEAENPDDEVRARVQALGEHALEAYEMVSHGEPRRTPITGETRVKVADLLEEDGINPPPDEPESAPQEPEKPSETGADVPLTKCPHCNWPLAMPDGPEPEYTLKLKFLQQFLGGKCFTHDFLIMGDNVRVKFRALTMRELDRIYVQAYQDIASGRAQTQRDFLERLNQYRLCLQLQEIHSTEPGMLDHEFPSGLSEATNPDASEHWQCDEPAEGETELRQILDHMVSKVLKTEHIFRVVTAACNTFNRIAEKMEANMDNSPFWKKTEPPF